MYVSLIIRFAEVILKFICILYKLQIDHFCAMSKQKVHFNYQISMLYFGKQYNSQSRLLLFRKTNIEVYAAILKIQI